MDAQPDGPATTGLAPHMLSAAPDKDPYKKWWDLAGPGGCHFKPQDEGMAVSHLSSRHYKPALIQVWRLACLCIHA